MKAYFKVGEDKMVPISTFGSFAKLFSPLRGPRGSM
jgi:hypothetical protein